MFPNTRILLFTLCLSFTAVSASAQEHATEAEKAIGVERVVPADHLGGRQYALIIGIDDYADEQIPDLTLCEQDAEAMYALLSQGRVAAVEPQDATLLLGPDATTRNLRKELHKLRQVPADSTVFIFFSGHGAKEGDEAFWVTQDAELNALAATAFTNRDVHAYVERIPSERVIVMIDACYAAATVKGGRKSIVDVDAALRRFTGKGQAYLMASGSGEEAIEATDLQHSVFTYFLLEGLRGKADADEDGVVVLPELQTFIDHNVAREAAKRNGIQKPTTITDVQEPAKFRLTINHERLTQRISADRQKAEAMRHAKLFVRTAHEKKNLTDEEAAFCLDVLETPSFERNESQRRVVAKIKLASKGEMRTEELKARLVLPMLRMEQRVGVDENDAIARLKRRAARKDEKAEFELGVAYREGHGVRIDHEESLRWFVKAANHGSAGAMVMAGLAFQQGRGTDMNQEEAVRYFRQAADAEHPGGYFNLGIAHLRGDGIGRDRRKAVKLFEKTVASGESHIAAQAAYLAGSMHASGMGVPRDFDASENLLRNAIEQDHVKAMAILGSLLWNNPERGGGRDEARRLIRRAAAAGDSMAEAMLRKLQGG